MDSPAPAVVRERVLYIDALRGLGILIVIVIHTMVPFYDASAAIYQTWNYLHFVVPLIMFVSGLTLATTGSAGAQTILENLRWIGKRVWRLLGPYYLFLLIWCLVMALVGIPSDRLMLQAARSLLVLDNVGGAALLRLMLGMTLLFPLFALFYRKGYMGRLMVIVAGLFVLARAAYLDGWGFEYDLIGWCIPFCAGMVTAYLLREKRFSAARLIRWLIICSAIGALAFLLIILTGPFSLRTIVLINHEYPQDYIFLIYAAFAVPAIVAASLAAEKFLQRQNMVRRCIRYFGENSLEIFLYHYLFMYLFSRLLKTWGILGSPTVWLPYFLLVVASAIIAGAIAKRLFSLIGRISGSFK